MAEAPAPVSEDDPFAGPTSALAADLQLHQAYRVAYALFFDLLAGASTKKDPSVIHQLRQQPVYLLAEFFYLLKAYELDSPDKLQVLIDMHNAQMTSLMKDRDRLRRYGFAANRLGRAVIDEATASKMIVNYKHFGAFDQSDLGRLLVETMSPETCRKTVVTLASAGFLNRVGGVYNAIMVSSPGVLERLFAQYIRVFRESFEAGAGSESA